jgi:heavy metal sensor kinase
MSLSIRWRLTVWNAVALAVLLIGFGTLVYILLARVHYQRIDRSLQVELDELEDKMNGQEGSSRDSRLRHWIYEFKEHENIFCIVYDPSGKVHERTEELAEQSVPAAPAVAPGERRYENRDVPIVGHQRTLSAPLRMGDEDFTVLLMAPLEEVDLELGLLRTALLTAVPVVLLLAGAMGYVLARKALVPMDALHRLTEEITADRLDRRLPVGNPGDEFGRLAQTINAMIARLERSFAEIRRFTADASHELRTPLAAIRTEAEVALGKALSPAEHQQLLGSILEECERLTRLTEQLLALCREDAGSARPAHVPLDLGALVSHVVETMRPLAEAKDLNLQAESNGSLAVLGDEVRLRQVFYNLLDNAIKYTPAGGRIEVRLHDRDGTAIVTLHDTGIGIPPEHLPRVFDRFYRVDKARSRAEGGTGLGLSIAQSIIAAHGGRIELESQLGQGTACTVTLPQEPNHSPGISGPSAGNRAH